MVLRFAFRELTTPTVHTNDKVDHNVGEGPRRIDVDGDDRKTTYHLLKKMLTSTMKSREEEARRQKEEMTKQKQEAAQDMQV